MNNKDIIKVLGVIGSVVSIISFAFYFLPKGPNTPAVQQAEATGPNSIGVNAGRDATVIVNPVPPAVPQFKQPDPFPDEIDYRKLSSPALGTQFIGKIVVFRAMYLSEWTQILGYNNAGVDTTNAIFLNHRDISYTRSDLALGTSDNEFPPFPISLPVGQQGLIYNLSRGDFILVKGEVIKPKLPDMYKRLNIPIDYARIYVKVKEITKLNSK